MSEFLSNFHFIRPFVLLLLLLPLGFFWHYARSRGAQFFLGAGLR